MAYFEPDQEALHYEPVAMQMRVWTSNEALCHGRPAV